MYRRIIFIASMCVFSSCIEIETWREDDCARDLRIGCIPFAFVCFLSTGEPLLSLRFYLHFSISNLWSWARDRFQLLLGTQYARLIYCASPSNVVSCWTPRKGMNSHQKERRSKNVAKNSVWGAAAYKQTQKSFACPKGCINNMPHQTIFKQIQISSNASSNLSRKWTIKYKTFPWHNSYFKMCVQWHSHWS